MYIIIVNVQVAYNILIYIKGVLYTLPIIVHPVYDDCADWYSNSTLVPTSNTHTIYYYRYNSITHRPY